MRNIDRCIRLALYQGVAYCDVDIAIGFMVLISDHIIALASYLHGH